MNLYFTKESQDTLWSFPLFIIVKVITKLNLEHRKKIEIKNKKLKSSRCSSHSPDNREFSHFTLLF